MSREQDMGRVDTYAHSRPRLIAARFLLPAGWLLAAIGYYGPWVGHPTAALTLSGVDLAEFVKFLPGVLDGTLRTMRQAFCMPPLAIVVSIALLVGTRWLHYPPLLRALFLVLAVPVSLQLLPPAWSLGSLMTTEFLPQTIALCISWLLLAGFWLWRRLPFWLTAPACSAFALAAAGLSTWQYLAVKPAIDEVYGSPPPVGWGFYVCMAGLLTIAAAGAMQLRRRHTGSMRLWTGE